MLFHPFCYFKRALRCLRQNIILNFQDFFFAVNTIVSNTLSVMAWISYTFENKSITERFLRSRWQIHLDRLGVIIYINFESSQPPFSLKEQLLLPWSGKFRQIKITNLIAKNLTYLSNPTKFLMPWRHLLLLSFII